MRRGLGFHDRHSPFRFDPATLFIGGAVKGAFYDPSNITTLFQDDAGTTPVTAVEQTVGRILDLSSNSNHATQSVLASRPTYRARYNLLTYSEQFDQGAWTKQQTSISANAAVSPDGTTTADAIVTSASTGNRLVRQSITIPSSAATYSVYLKANTASSATLRILSSPTDVIVDFDLSNGTATAGGTITPVGNGWYRCSISGTVAAVTAYIYINDAATGVSIYAWGAQLLTSNDITTTGNAYQRVAAATSYDTSSPVWRPYLALDGVDDSLVTGSIDFTGTNKMTVWAGVTKNSDAAQGVVAELSATIASNNGAFLLSAPNSAAANYNWSSKGTTQVDNTVTTYAAPNTTVLTGQANIAGPSNIIRVNGAQAGSVATTQGTGNFGNYPLYIGRRNNASLPFNGRLYGLIVLGAAASDWQVYVTEQWMAGKTGLQF